MIELGVVRSETVPIVDGTANVQGLTDYVNGAKIEREPNVICLSKYLIFDTKLPIGNDSYLC